MTTTALPKSLRNLGEADEAGRLFAAHSECILAYCLRLLGSRPEAEDAMQTTFFYALRALQRDVVPESESAWLHAIAKNVCRWQQRSASRRCPISEVDLDTLTSSRPARPDEDGELLGLREALASIPDNQRQAIVLREWHGLSGGEIASRLELSERATHALLTRARRSLAHSLTSLPRRPTFGLNLGPLLLKFKSVLVGGSANAAATTAAVATLVVGGAVAVERANNEKHSPQPPAPNAAPIAQAGTSKPKKQAATASQRQTHPQSVVVITSGAPLPPTKTRSSSPVPPAQPAASVPTTTAAPAEPLPASGTPAPTAVATATTDLANAQTTLKLPLDLPALAPTPPPSLPPGQPQPPALDTDLPLELPPPPIPTPVNIPDLEHPPLP